MDTKVLGLSLSSQQIWMFLIPFAGGVSSRGGATPTQAKWIAFDLFIPHLTWSYSYYYVIDWPILMTTIIKYRYKVDYGNPCVQPSTCWLQQLWFQYYSIGHLTQLEVLNIYGNVMLTGLPDQIGQIRSLKELYIAGCGLEELPERYEKH